MKRRKQTAGEFLAELRSDANFRRREEDVAERLRVAAIEEKRKYAPVLHRLAESGFPAESIYDVAKNHAPLPPAAVDILVSSLSMFDDDERAQETLIRQLAARRKRG